MLAVVALSHLLASCAPTIAPRTMAAVVRVESGGDPLALHDNTSGRSFAPGDAREAAAWTTELLALGHSLVLGLSQINTANLPRLGLSVAAAFEPCANLRAGATVLSGDYRAASARFGAGQFALRSALGAYNSGSLYAGRAYVDRILAAAGLPPENVATRPVVDAAPPLIAHVATWPRRRTVSSMTRIAAPAASFAVVHTPGSPVEILVGTP